jgi:NAD(P)-dependent dehydrogenase (short-subunit alcohol dehydrogenase family)
MTDAFVDDALKGRVAFVAGGSSGINLAVACRFASKGAKIMLISRSAERLVAAAETVSHAGGTVIYEAADVRDNVAVQSALSKCHETFGPIDIVLSGAAGNFVAPVSQVSSNGFRTVVDIDLFGTYNVLKHSYPYLRRPGASLISITAPVADKPMIGQAHAGAAKAGVNTLTKVLAAEWGCDGVRVNAISPGFIANTEGCARLVGTPAREQRLVGVIPMRELGRASDIADLALFLATEHARYITGAVIDCDGGWLSDDLARLSTDDPM